MSAQDQDESQPPAAAPRDDELPEELRRNFRNALQPLAKLSRCDIIGDRKGYALTRFGEIIAEQALSKRSSEPTDGTHGDTFQEPIATASRASMKFSRLSSTGRKLFSCVYSGDVRKPSLMRRSPKSSPCAKTSPGWSSM